MVGRIIGLNSNKFPYSSGMYDLNTSSYSGYSNLVSFATASSNTTYIEFNSTSIKDAQNGDLLITAFSNDLSDGPSSNTTSWTQKYSTTNTSDGWHCSLYTKVLTSNTDPSLKFGVSTDSLSGVLCCFRNCEYDNYTIANGTLTTPSHSGFVQNDIALSVMHVQDEGQYIVPPSGWNIAVRHVNYLNSAAISSVSIAYKIIKSSEVGTIGGGSTNWSNVSSASVNNIFTIRLKSVKFNP